MTSSRQELSASSTLPSHTPRDSFTISTSVQRVRVAARLTIDRVSELPIYRQIVNQFLYLVAVGELRCEETLPSIRELALDLKVALNTASKAYEELEAAGVVQCRRGSGTFVNVECSQMVDRERRRIIMRGIDALFAEALELNIAPEELSKLILARESHHKRLDDQATWRLQRATDGARSL